MYIARYQAPPHPRIPYQFVPSVVLSVLRRFAPVAKRDVSEVNVRFEGW